MVGVLNSPDGSVFMAHYRLASLLCYKQTSGLRTVSLPRFKTLGLLRNTANNTVWAIVNESQIVELSTDGRILHQFSRPGTVVSWCFGQRNTGV